MGQRRRHWSSLALAPVVGPQQKLHKEIEEIEANSPRVFRGVAGLRRGLMAERGGGAPSTSLERLLGRRLCVASGPAEVAHRREGQQGVSRCRGWSEAGSRRREEAATCGIIIAVFRWSASRPVDAGGGGGESGRSSSTGRGSPSRFRLDGRQSHVR